MKSRRVLAMILVLAFVFALMAVNVAAATPRAACPKCGSNRTRPSRLVGGSDNTYKKIWEEKETNQNR